MSTNYRELVRNIGIPGGQGKKGNFGPKGFQGLDGNIGINGFIGIQGDTGEILSRFVQHTTYVDGTYGIVNGDLYNLYIPFKNIQDAIDASFDNDKIIVRRGTYNESLTISKNLIIDFQRSTINGTITVTGSTTCLNVLGYPSISVTNNALIIQNGAKVIGKFRDLSSTGSYCLRIIGAESQGIISCRDLSIINFNSTVINGESSGELNLRARDINGRMYFRDSFRSKQYFRDQESFTGGNVVVNLLQHNSSAEMSFRDSNSRNNYLFTLSGTSSTTRCNLKVDWRNDIAFEVFRIFDITNADVNAVFNSITFGWGNGTHYCLKINNDSTLETHYRRLIAVAGNYQKKPWISHTVTSASSISNIKINAQQNISGESFQLLSGPPGALTTVDFDITEEYYPSRFGVGAKVGANITGNIDIFKNQGINVARADSTFWYFDQVNQQFNFNLDHMNIPNNNALSGIIRIDGVEGMDLKIGGHLMTGESAEITSQSLNADGSNSTMISFEGAGKATIEYDKIINRESGNGGFCAYMASSEGELHFLNAILNSNTLPVGIEQSSGETGPNAIYDSSKLFFRGSNRLLGGATGGSGFTTDSFSISTVDVGSGNRTVVINEGVINSKSDFETEAAKDLQVVEPIGIIQGSKNINNDYEVLLI